MRVLHSEQPSPQNTKLVEGFMAEGATEQPVASELGTMIQGTAAALA